MKIALANFVRDLERHRRTLKRGGGRALLSLSEDEEGEGLELPDPAGHDPEASLDAAWRAELMQAATRALEAELAGQGKELYFRVFHDYLLADEELDYAAIARRHDLKPSDVSNYLQFAKKRFRSVLRAVVADTVGGREDLERELAWLFDRSGA